MQNQTLQGMDSKNVTIQRDGTPLANPEKTTEEEKCETATPEEESDEEVGGDEACFTPEYEDEEKVAQTVETIIKVEEEDDTVKKEIIMVQVEENVEKDKIENEETGSNADDVEGEANDIENEADDNENEASYENEACDQNEADNNESETNSVKNQVDDTNDSEVDDIKNDADNIENSVSDNENEADNNENEAANNENEAYAKEEDNEEEDEATNDDKGDDSLAVDDVAQDKQDGSQNEGEVVLTMETCEDAEMNTEETMNCDQSRSSSPLDSVRYLDREVNTSLSSVNVNSGKEDPPEKDENLCQNEEIESKTQITADEEEPKTLTSADEEEPKTQISADEEGPKFLTSADDEEPKIQISADEEIEGTDDHKEKNTSDDEEEHEKEENQEEPEEEEVTGTKSDEEQEEEEVEEADEKEEVEEVDEETKEVENKGEEIIEEADEDLEEVDEEVEEVEGEDEGGEEEVAKEMEEKQETQSKKVDENLTEQGHSRFTEIIAQDELGDAWDSDGDDRGATWSEDNMENEESEKRQKSKHHEKNRKSRKGDSRVVVEENSQDSSLMEEALLPISEFPRIPKKKRRSKSSRSDPDSEKSSLNKSKQTKEEEDEEESFKRTVMKEEDVIIVKVETGRRLHEFKTEKKDVKEISESSSKRDRDDRKDRERDSKRGYDRDKDRDRDREGSSRHKHRRERYRSRSRSRDRRDRSRSRDRSRRSRSRERKRHDRSRSRSYERHHKRRRRDRSRDREKASRRSRSPSRRTQEKENRYSGDDKRQKRREEKVERKEELTLWTKKSRFISEGSDSGEKKKVKSPEHRAKHSEDNKQSRSDEDIDKNSAIPEDMRERLKIPPLMSRKITVVTSKKPNEEQNQQISVITSDKTQNMEVIGSQPQEVSNPPTEVIDMENEEVSEDKAKVPNISAIQIPPLMSRNITLNQPVESAGEYDPAFPTDDPEESSPPLPPLDTEPMVYNVPPPQMSFPPHMIEEGFAGHQRLSPLPPHQPPPPSQSILGEGGTLLMPTGDHPQPLIQQPQNVPPMPLGLRMLPQGYQPGMPPQRPVMINPMLINRGPFSRFPRFQPGHLPRFNLQVPTSGDMMPLQNRFGPRMAHGNLAGQLNLVNGGFEPIPQESGPPPRFQHILRGPGDPSISHDPRMQGLLSAPGGPPPGSHPRHLSIQESSIPPLLPELDPRDRLPTVSLPGGPGEQRAEGPPQSLQGLSQLEQITHITKILNVQAQLAMIAKENQPGEAPGNEPNGDDVFKVPLPPHGGGKQKLVLGGAMNSNGKEEAETMEVVDMDMSSPLDDGNIELHLTQDKNSDKNVFGSLGSDSSSKSSDRRSKRDKKGSDSHSGKVRFKGAHDSEERTSKSSRVKVKEKKHKPAEDEMDDVIFDDLMNDMSNDEMPSSAVELTNKEKYLKKLHLQERVVDEVKVALKPFYNTKQVSKEQYKEILRKAVPKVCHSKSGDINPVKIKVLVEAYVSKYKRDAPKKSVKLAKDSAVKANGEVKTKTKSNR